MPRCRSKIIIYLNFILSLTVRISTVRTRFVPDSLSSENSPHIFTSYQTSGTPAPKRTKEISCFTCLNLLIQNRFFFFNIHLRVIIIRSSIGIIICVYIALIHCNTLTTTHYDSLRLTGIRSLRITTTHYDSL